MIVKLINELETCSASAIVVRAGKYMVDDNGEKNPATAAAKMIVRFCHTLYTEYSWLFD